MENLPCMCLTSHVDERFQNSKKALNVLYSRITKCLKRSRPTVNLVQESTTIRNRQQNMAVMKVFLSIVIVFFLCWTPQGVFLLLKLAFPTVYKNDSCLLFVGLFFYIFPSLGSAINPVIPFSSSTNFSKAFKEMFKCSASNPCSVKCGRVSS